MVHLAVYPQVDFANMPPPMPKTAHSAHPLAANIRHEQRTKVVPPEPNGFMTKVDLSLEEQILDVLKLSGKRTYINTTSRITSGGELK